MGWGDDLLKKVQTNVSNIAQEAASNVTQSATDFFGQTISKGLEKVGSKPLGNLSAAEIEAGERGASADTVAAQGLKIGAPLLIGAGVVAYFIFHRRR